MQQNELRRLLYTNPKLMNSIKGINELKGINNTSFNCVETRLYRI